MQAERVPAVQPALRAALRAAPPGRPEPELVVEPAAELVAVAVADKLA